MSVCVNSVNSVCVVLCVGRGKRNKLRDLSPRVKYTDRPTAACRRS
jgi:hypothetical protein